MVITTLRSLDVKSKVSKRGIAVRKLVMQPRLTAIGTCMPHGITQCYLPPGRGDISAFTVAKAHIDLATPEGSKAEQTQALH